MKITGVEMVEKDGTARLRADIIYDKADRQGRKQTELWIEVPAEHGGMFNTASPAFLMVSLLPTMWVGENIVYDGPVDKKTKLGLSELRRAFRRMFPQWIKPIEIDYRGAEPNTQGPRKPGHAVFFSAGVDAFHNAYRVSHDPLLSEPGCEGYLLPIQGFDVPLDRADLFSRIVGGAEAVAGRTGWKVVPIRTNIKDIFFPSPVCLGWTEIGFSPSLSGIGHALSGRLGKVHIASGVCYHQHSVDASACRTDPFWSSNDLEVMNIGADVTRLEKIQEMAEWRDVLRHLRICMAVQSSDPPNCGMCKKCVRTIIALYGAGVLPQAAAAFPGNANENIVEISRKAWSRSHLDLDLFHEIAELLETHPVDDRSPAVARNLREGLRSMEPSTFKKLIREWDARYLGKFLDRTQTKIKRVTGLR